jgi:hypothetical protein
VPNKATSRPATALPRSETPSPASEQAPETVAVRITGLDATSLGCVTLVFYRQDQAVERVRLNAGQSVVEAAVEADSVYLSGTDDGCPWRSYSLRDQNNQDDLVDGQTDFHYLIDGQTTLDFVKKGPSDSTGVRDPTPTRAAYPGVGIDL